MSTHKSADSGIGFTPITRDAAKAAQQLAVDGSRTGARDGLRNGPGAAAILSAGIGSFALGVFAFAGDASPAILHAFNFWNPTGPLSGVTLSAVVVWLAAWYSLARVWAARSVNLGHVNLAAFAMLIGGLLLTFPPFMDFLQGK